jgi:type II secretory ATPase GspE/PulE/Tfp pilus assembly ATPase PilB-like protein
MEASITGHLVLSTLHTNDAISAISRLKSLSVAPYLIGSGMLAVMAQRLVRRLCDECKEPVPLKKEDLERYSLDGNDLEQTTIFQATGFPHCLNTGGCFAIVEIVAFDTAFRAMSLRGHPIASSIPLQKSAV